MKKIALTILALGLSMSLASEFSPAQAQSPILMDLYGQGVHAFNGNQHQEAYAHLSMAINNGLKDPRAYYFRGMVSHASGRPYEAESDWEQGAQLEAQGKIVGSIGNALLRYQGPGRMKLEEIRTKAKLQFLSQAAMRSKQRFGEIIAAEGDVLRGRPAAAGARNPPPMPPAADDNPFSDDKGDAAVDSDDALEGAMTPPPKNGPAVATGDDGGAGTPFGEDAPAASTDESDPFGSGGGGGDDPFSGDDPFGN